MHASTYVRFSVRLGLWECENFESSHESERDIFINSRRKVTPPGLTITLFARAVNPNFEIKRTRNAAWNEAGRNNYIFRQDSQRSKKGTLLVKLSTREGNSDKWNWRKEKKKTIEESSFLEFSLLFESPYFFQITISGEFHRFY